MTDALDGAILAAHDTNDKAKLATLYAQAADKSEALGDKDAACFFLTQAYVFALDAGLQDAATLNKRLAKYGRDVVQEDLTS